MILQKRIEDKTILWIQHSNQYLIVEPIVAEITSLLNDNIQKKEIITILSKKINAPNKELSNFIDSVSQLLIPPTKKNENNISIKTPSFFKYHSSYQINNIIIKVNYLSDYEKSLVHPKFAHLEIKKPLKSTYIYNVYSNNKHISFSIDTKIIGTWSLNQVHFFQGKFSMKIVEHMHLKKENEWLGVFHASAISNRKSSMLFLGDSGNGKSTSLALLQADGFTCLADDFVPLDAKKQYIYSFPSAISIKRNSLKTLLPIYPELENSAEYHFKKLNKIVRYLTPNNPNYNEHLPCKTLIFIKYKKESNLIISKISNLKAFEQLVPDSWLSPLPENAKKFLDWFEKLPCYELTYSNNKKMINTVHKIFNNDL